MEKHITNKTGRHGFALIAAMTIMFLMTGIAVVLYTFSTVAQRSSAIAASRTQAQANARMGLMLALGELQKQMGPDQRVSAPGAIASTDETVIEHLHWTGVWDAWHAGPTHAGGDATSEHSTIDGAVNSGMAPTYEPRREDHFRSWLVSLAPDDLAPDKADRLAQVATLPLAGDTTPSAGDDAVQLVGEGSLGDTSDTKDYVRARLLSVTADANGASGRYGWWVGDESQKARIMVDSYLPFDRPPDNEAESIYRSFAPASMNNSAIDGLENIGNAGQRQLGHLPSLESLDLVTEVTGRPSENFHSVTPYSFQVLADVREGGLKRDLSTLLERPISLTEDGDEFMLYRFDTAGEERVPIQDLAAYYQLYDDDPAWEISGELGGVEHDSDPSRVMQVGVPDYGDDGNRDKFLRQYTALYRNPVPIKVQFVLGVGAKEMEEWERIQGANNRQGSNSIRDTDRYKLLLGIKPVVTLWNPNNVPLVMGTDSSQIMKIGIPPFSLRWKKYRADGSEFESSLYLNMSAAGGGTSTHTTGNSDRFILYMASFQFARDTPIVFQPGEVKMFTAPIDPLNFLESGADPNKFGNKTIFQAEEFTPDGFFVIANSALWEKSSADTLALRSGAGYTDVHLVFGVGDKLDLQVAPETRGQGSTVISCTNEVRGSALQFFLQDTDYHTGTDTGGTSEHFRNYQFISRFGFWSNSRDIDNVDFNHKLTLSGFPEKKMIPFVDNKIEALSMDDILATTEGGEATALLSFTMTAACEKGELHMGGGDAGRRTVSRPFLHGAVLKAPQISGNEASDLYEYGWEWQVNKINSLEEAFQDDGDSRGYYGGGYTPEDGVTHVVQQYLPALPPISIASLSSARLGGYSLANAPAMSTKDADVILGKSGDWGNSIRNAPAHGDFRQVTATGQGGLNPHTLQAIGNAYAHPNIPPDKAYTTFTQILNADRDESNPPVRPYADHSYLANKALWDEFFFSSITPQPAKIPLFSGKDKTAIEVADDFMFSDAVLPNRRFVPYLANLTQEAFDTLKAEYSTYTDGFADKIAAHMMFAGPFNINSTSVEAWKVLFSSLKGKSLAYLKDQASELASLTPDGTPVAPGMLANATPIQSSDLSEDANTPPEQWTSSRSLSDQEIEALAAAMVHQVKLRGPFLSLSEFINRRLDPDPANMALSLKGALQAALDFEGDSTLGLPAVTINAAFRTPERSLDSEIAGMDVASSQENQAGFPEALQGPVAYGSTPYVDQSDILRHIGSALTPRGDTFVIRAYGDSMDTQGEVLARAWCEAVVQRVPDYVDGSNEPHMKQADPALSEANRNFGRQFRIVKFRWLDADEV